MKWEKKHKSYLDDCSKRVVQKFLLFPLTISGETRWLEFVEVEQTYWATAGRWIDSRFKGNY